VIGRRFTQGLLFLASETSDSSLSWALSEAPRAGLVRKDPNRVKSYYFVHALVAEALFDSRDADWRAQALATISTAIEKVTNSIPLIRLEVVTIRRSESLRVTAEPGDSRPAQLRVAQLSHSGAAWVPFRQSGAVTGAARCRLLQSYAELEPQPTVFPHPHHLPRNEQVNGSSPFVGSIFALGSRPRSH
jgi:hypothetical protein